MLKQKIKRGGCLVERNTDPSRTQTYLGKTKYPEHYFRWRQMRYRCNNPKSVEYVRYGARGIYVCEAWNTFKVFQKWCLSTFEEGKTIDRINNDGPYSPDNCRWATPHEQQMNGRRHTPARLAAIKYASTKRRPTREYRKRDSRGCFT